MKKKRNLGASPDGLITEPSRKDPHGIFDAKYIIFKDGEGLKDALMWNSICKTSDSGVLQVNKNHMYFYLVQQRRFVVERLYGVLSILESNEGFFCTEVSFEHKWWKEKQKNTEQFYDKYIIYELAYTRLAPLRWPTATVRTGVGIVLTDHIQSTFRKSSIKLYIFITT